jgi:hypothetical protein
MEPTFEEFLAAMQNRSPAGGAPIPLMLAPNLMDNPVALKAFQVQNQPAPTPSPSPKLSPLTPAAQAALKKRTAPKPVRPTGPLSPLEQQALNTSDAQAKAAAANPGKNTVVGQDRDYGRQNDTSHQVTLQENSPYIPTQQEISGSPSGGDIEAIDPHLPKGHPPVSRGALLPSLRTLKAGLEEYQAARQGNLANAELRAKLAPYMAGQASLAPILTFLNSKGTKTVEAPAQAPALGAEFFKMEESAQKDKASLAALENKLIDQVSIPQGQKFGYVEGRKSTEKEGGKDTSKVQPIIINNGQQAGKVKGQAGFDSGFRRELGDVGKKVNGTMEGLNKVSQALASGEIQQIKASISTLGRSVNAEKGAMSDSDTRRNYMSTLDNEVATADAFFGGKTRITYSELQPYLKMVERAREELETSSQSMLGAIEAKYLYDQEHAQDWHRKAFQEISGSYRKRTAPKEAPAAPPSADADKRKAIQDMIKNQLAK